MKLQEGCAYRINAAQAQQDGQATGAKDVTWIRCDFSTKHGKALHSPVHFTLARHGDGGTC